MEEILLTPFLARALQEIKYFQKRTDPLLPKTRFHMLMHEIVSAENIALRVSAGATKALQELTEDFLVRTLAETQFAIFHAGRKTLRSGDMSFTRYLKNVGKQPGRDPSEYVGRVLKK